MRIPVNEDQNFAETPRELPGGVEWCKAKQTLLLYSASCSKNPMRNKARIFLLVDLRTLLL